MEKIVGIGEIAVSNDVNDKIKTFALASCVAVTAYSSNKRAAGMIHAALPSFLESDAAKNPYYYAHSGVLLLLEKMYKEFGCTKSELDVKIFGGADSIRPDDVFNIGKKNVEMVRKVLNNLNIRYDDNEVGGLYSRTLELEVQTGRTDIIMQPINI